MLRLLTRFLGLLLLAGGFIALIVDGTRSIAGGRLMVTSLRNGVADALPALSESLSAVQKSSFLWDLLLGALLFVPVSVACGGLGALFIIFSHKQEEALRYWRR